MGFASFTNDEQWAWYAYDYAWRKIYLGDDRHYSPIDPDGKFFERDLFSAALEWQRNQRGSSTPYLGESA